MIINGILLIINIGPIYGVDITPDNSFMVTCSGDKSIKLFDLYTKQEVYKFQDAHNGTGGNSKDS